MEKKKFNLLDYKDYIKDFSVYEDLTPREAIIAKCHDCCCYQPSEVKMCEAKSCPLYQFKQKWYKIPRKTVLLTDEQKKERADRMRSIGKRNKKKVD